MRRLLALCVLASSNTALASSLEAVRPSRFDAAAAATSCSSCHGASVSLAIPSLRDLSSEQIALKMINYRNQTTEGTLMPRIARGYSEQEIRAIASSLAN